MSLRCNLVCSFLLVFEDSTAVKKLIKHRRDFAWSLKEGCTCSQHRAVKDGVRRDFLDEFLLGSPSSFTIKVDKQQVHSIAMDNIN